MRVSAVRLPEHTGAGDAARAAEAIVAQAAAAAVDLVVFPAYTGMAFGGRPQEFYSAIYEISIQYPHIGICPGSTKEYGGGNAYHCSELIVNGKTVLHQRQLYLSRRERETGFSHGERLEYADFMGCKTCIIQATDVFYPQVSRMAALDGAELALCPVAYPKSMGRPLQTAGVWREAQLNLFFAVESCFRGTLDAVEYDGEQTVQAPLAIDVPGSGFLARGNDSATAELDNEERKKGISRFDVLAQLNPILYENMGMFGNGKS